MKSQSLTLTLIGKSDEIQAQEPKKPKGEEGKGVAYLAVVHAGAWGKERAGRGGTARRDLATGAPRPSRSTAARSPAGGAHAGEGAGDGARAPPIRRLSRSVLLWLR